MLIIEKCSLFRGMSAETLAKVESLAQVESYRSGAFVFQGGDSADSLYILEDGRLRLRFSEGGQVAYTLSEPGDAFGWSAMVSQAAYTLSAQCVSHVRIAKLGSSQLFRILEDSPRDGLIFFRHLAEFIGQRLFNSYKATVSVHGERSSLSYG